MSTRIERERILLTKIKERDKRIATLERIVDVLLILIIVLALFLLVQSLLL